MWDGPKKRGRKKKNLPKKKITNQDRIDAVLLGNKVGEKVKMSKAQMKTVIDPKIDNIDRVCTMKEDLLNKVEILGESLPPNALDHLIDELGGPENVAEASSMLIIYF